VFYGQDPTWSRPRAFVQRFPDLFRWVNAKYYVDEFYEAAFIGPCKQLGAQLWPSIRWRWTAWSTARPLHPDGEHAAHWFDAKVVDGLVNLVAWLLQQLSSGFRRFQTGRVQKLRLRHVPRLPGLRLLEVPRLSGPRRSPRFLCPSFAHLFARSAD